MLFLGEWCLLYNRRHVWKNIADAQFAAPYGIDIFQREQDLALIESLYKRLAMEIVQALNAYHGTGHSYRYWMIILGHWLKRYLLVAVNRYFTIERALQNYQISSTLVFESDYTLATRNSADFIWATDNHVWNHVLYSRVMKFLGNPDFEIDSNSIKSLRQYRREIDAGNQGAGKNLKTLAVDKLEGFLKLLKRDSDAFLINTYLPRKTELQLQLSLGQAPVFWQNPSHAEADFNLEKRSHFKIPTDGFSGFELFLRQQLVDMIPICFLEGYDQIARQADLLPWPKKPSFIFTSNSFDTDEVFKVWAGKMVEKGTPYFTGQHGSNYGTHIYNRNPGSQEQRVSDRFLTWGWKDANKKNVPAFVFRTVGKKRKDYNPQGDLLLIQHVKLHRVETHDCNFFYKVFQENQFKFVSGLSKQIREKLMVRLHGAWRLSDWCDAERWRDYDPSLRLETGAASMGQLISGSRLVVHSYDSTGILETLNLNIPTLCFWHGGFEQLLPEAKPYYELLKSAGIYANSPNEAAEMVAEYWPDVEKWWCSKRVQDCRVEFCNQFAKSETNPVRVLKKILTSPGAATL